MMLIAVAERVLAAAVVPSVLLASRSSGDGHCSFSGQDIVPFRVVRASTLLSRLCLLSAQMQQMWAKESEFRAFLESRGDLHVNKHQQT